VEPFYRKVSTIPRLDHLTVFLLDEFGGLPPGDPGLCASMIRRHLLDRLGEEPTVHVPATDPPNPEGYEALVDDGGLDLAILGLGANGHVGMNEPGSTPDTPTRVVELAPTTSEHAEEYGATETPTWGVTLGLRPLLEAGEVWLLVTGAHKREILNAALHGPIAPEVPASFLRRHPSFKVFADASAAG